MRSTYPALALWLAALALAGCAVIHPATIVRVDSITGPDSTQRKQYILLPGNKNTQPSDLQFREFSAYVNRALAKQGFAPAKDPAEANLTIFLAYGIGRPQQYQEVYTMPTLGQGGFTAGTTYVNSYTTHPHFLILEAVDPADYQQSEDPASLWKTMVTSAATSEDLRRRFPLLVAAAQPYIGKNTGHIIDVPIPEGDPRLTAIMGNEVATEPKGTAQPVDRPTQPVTQASAKAPMSAPPAQIEMPPAARPVARRHAGPKTRAARQSPSGLAAKESSRDQPVKAPAPSSTEVKPTTVPAAGAAGAAKTMPKPSAKPASPFFDSQSL